MFVQRFSHIHYCWTPSLSSVPGAQSLLMCLIPRVFSERLHTKDCAGLSLGPGQLLGNGAKLIHIKHL